uniref:hypothetical protein n=1 Tax=Alistipes sp. TaxID=1872444 RepID=UPI0040564C2F
MARLSSFVDDIEGNVTVDQVEGKDYVIDGNGFNYDGTIYIDGNSRYTGAETLTIRNINFATDKDNINFIEQNSADNAVRYPHNVTVENCSFRATGVDVIALKIRQGFNITIKDCVADGVTRANTSGMHSLGQFYGCTGITIDGVNFNAGRGVSFGTSLDVVVKNSTFVAESYGLRADASVATTLTLENVNISANLPVVARQCKADYTINISGENTFDAPGYQIVFTKGDDATPFETPTSNWKLNGGNGLRVFPGSNILYAYDAENLQYLLDNATGNTEIHLAADIVGNVIVPEIANSTITINGRYYNYDGYFQINGKTKYEGATTVFENIEFETANSANLLDSAFIYCGTYNGDTNKRYPDNVTIKGCTFTAKDAAVHNSVGAKFWSMDGNLVIEDCAANGLHSLVQLTSCSTADVTIDRVGIVNGKNGISLGDAKLSYIKNTNIASNEYGIRANGTGEYTLNLENVNIKATKPVIVRNASKNYTVNFTGDNTLETSGYQVIFTTGSDDATFVAPAAYTLTGGDDFRVFPEPATASTWDQFTAAIDAGNKEIKLTADITYSGNYSLQKNVSINLNGHAITMPMLYLFSTATIKNGTINGKVYARTNSDVVLDTVVFSGEVSDNLSTEGHLAIQGGCNVYAKNCVFDATTVNGSQTRSLSIEGRSSGTLKFEGCDFKFRSYGTGSAKYKKQVYVNTLSGNATLDFTRCKFNGKAPNIMFAATYPFTNFTMSDCDNTAPTLEINRAKDAVTEADWTYLSTMIENNSYSQIRIFYTGGTSEYFK